jgi:hypothetical protein
MSKRKSKSFKSFKFQKNNKKIQAERENDFYVTSRFGKTPIRRYKNAINYLKEHTFIHPDYLEALKIVISFEGMVKAGEIKEIQITKESKEIINKSIKNVVENLTEHSRYILPRNIPFQLAGFLSIMKEKGLQPKVWEMIYTSDMDKKIREWDEIDKDGNPLISYTEKVILFEQFLHLAHDSGSILVIYFNYFNGDDFWDEQDAWTFLERLRYIMDE